MVPKLGPQIKVILNASKPSKCGAIEEFQKFLGWKRFETIERLSKTTGIINSIKKRKDRIVRTLVMRCYKYGLLQNIMQTNAVQDEKNFMVEEIAELLKQAGLRVAVNKISTVHDCQRYERTWNLKKKKYII